MKQKKWLLKMNKMKKIAIIIQLITCLNIVKAVNDSSRISDVEQLAKKIQTIVPAIQREWGYMCSKEIGEMDRMLEHWKDYAPAAKYFLEHETDDLKLRTFISFLIKRVPDENWEESKRMLEWFVDREKPDYGSAREEAIKALYWRNTDEELSKKYTKYLYDRNHTIRMLTADELRIDGTSDALRDLKKAKKHWTRVAEKDTTSSKKILNILIKKMDEAILEIESRKQYETVSEDKLPEEYRARRQFERLRKLLLPHFSHTIEEPPENYHGPQYVGKHIKDYILGARKFTDYEGNLDITGKLFDAFYDVREEDWPPVEEILWYMLDRYPHLPWWRVQCITSITRLNPNALNTERAKKLLSMDDYGARHYLIEKYRDIGNVDSLPILREAIQTYKDEPNGNIISEGDRMNLIKFIEEAISTIESRIPARVQPTAINGGIQ